MLTKMLAAVVMTGALVVAGDAAIQKYGSSFEFSDCCPIAQACGLVKAKTAAPSSCCSVSTNCCSVGLDCCEPVSECCTSGLTYCTQTGEVVDGSCCEVVNGRYRCLVTGTISDTNCCVPIDE